MVAMSYFIFEGKKIEAKKKKKEKSDHTMHSVKIHKGQIQSHGGYH